MSITLTEEQWKIFNLLLKSSTRKAAHEIVAETGLDHPIVMGSLTYAEGEGWVKIEEEPREELVPAENIAEILNLGVPERQLLPLLIEKGKIPIREVAEICNVKNIPMNEVIKWGSQREWLNKDKGDLVVTEAGRKALSQKDADELALDLAVKSSPFYLDSLKAAGVDANRVKMLLDKRPVLAKIKPRTIRHIELTPAGKKVLSTDVKVIREKNQLTSEDITNGDWSNIRLRKYDVTLAAEKVYPAKIHLMQKIIQQARKAFLEMGFTEIVHPMVESAFWNFDALFQPQDHPARDMQDTFYLARPADAQLPAKEMIERVRQTHENGWETGSTGWGYNWNLERARQTVLRTHTTASSIRALALNPNPPRKVFCVGKVFRNEAISYKHLPEFFQVDGIIIDEKANLATLLGTLTEFYRKMGFNRIKFKPGFFPYTEPSAEAFFYMESKKAWIELGGSGIFRPEVTRPFGCNVPVLAWGLGLDRLAMMRYGLSDIRELYWSDLDRLKEVSLCQ
ncbi:phenylalanine--tRNA ligase subunit alpha [candidate division KSB1 bacterium]|nr:phenylalanine--tRNA ligase subunit alpha [candidate division KSB1 bacterium]